MVEYYRVACNICPLPPTTVHCACEKRERERMRMATNNKSNGMNLKIFNSTQVKDL